MIFVTRALTKCTRQTIEAAILEKSTAVYRKSKLRCFQIGKYLNHCVIIMVFLWSYSTYDQHINNSGQDSLTRPFFELQFRSKLEACARSYRTASQYPEITAVLFAIKTTKQSLIKSCLRWLLVTLGQSQVMSST